MEADGDGVLRRQRRCSRRLRPRDTRGLVVVLVIAVFHSLPLDASGERAPLAGELMTPFVASAGRAGQTAIDTPVVLLGTRT